MCVWYVHCEAVRMHWCVRVQDDLAYPKLIVAPIRFSAMGGVVCALRSMPCFGAGHFRLSLTEFVLSP